MSQLASADEVLAFLRTQNLHRLDLSRLAWRLRDAAFFGRVLELLRARMHYDATVWSFALLHRDAAATQEYLAQQDAITSVCGPVLDSPLLQLAAEDRAAYEHSEFEPLFVARSHRIGPWAAIENPDVSTQWHRCVDVLVHRPQLRARDWTEVTYYLLLQGRIDDALASFARVDAAQVQTKLQYDYLAAYVAMYRADVETARRIASGYRDYPVARWRLLFGEVLQQLDEAGGGAAVAVDPQSRTSQQSQLAATEPQLDLAVDGGRVVIRHKNVARCELRYHLLDVEFAFSNSPFAQQGLAAVGWVAPARTDSVDLPQNAAETAVPLPAEFARSNVVVEVRAQGLVRRTPSLASAMTVQTSDNYGQLQVRAKDGAPLAKVYVKVYARNAAGAVRFHKDGYTDLRGRFDYASVSTAGGGDAERYALLVLSDTDGAVLREVAAPTR